MLTIPIITKMHKCKRTKFRFDKSSLKTNMSKLLLFAISQYMLDIKMVYRKGSSFKTASTYLRASIRQLRYDSVIYQMRTLKQRPWSQIRFLLSSHWLWYYYHVCVCTFEYIQPHFAKGAVSLREMLLVFAVWITHVGFSGTAHRGNRTRVCCLGDSLNTEASVSHECECVRDFP